MIGRLASLARMTTNANALKEQRKAAAMQSVKNIMNLQALSQQNQMRQAELDDLPTQRQRREEEYNLNQRIKKAQVESAEFGVGNLKEDRDYEIKSRKRQEEIDKLVKRNNELKINISENALNDYDIKKNSMIERQKVAEDYVANNPEIASSMFGSKEIAMSEAKNNTSSFFTRMQNVSEFVASAERRKVRQAEQTAVLNMVPKSHRDMYYKKLDIRNSKDFNDNFFEAKKTIDMANDYSGMFNVPYEDAFSMADRYPKETQKAITDKVSFNIQEAETKAKDAEVKKRISSDLQGIGTAKSYANHIRMSPESRVAVDGVFEQYTANMLDYASKDAKKYNEERVKLGKAVEQLSVIYNDKFLENGAELYLTPENISKLGTDEFLDGLNNLAINSEEGQAIIRNETERLQGTHKQMEEYAKSLGFVTDVDGEVKGDVASMMMDRDIKYAVNNHYKQAFKNFGYAIAGLGSIAYGGYASGYADKMFKKRLDPTTLTEISNLYKGYKESKRTIDYLNTNDPALGEYIRNKLSAREPDASSMTKESFNIARYVLNPVISTLDATLQNMKASASAIRSTYDNPRMDEML